MKQLFASALAAAVLHITPTVELVTRPDTVRRLLPGADQFVERDLHLSSADADRLKQATDWTPEHGVLTFYIGKENGQEVGILEFVRVDTPHGGVEVATGFTAQHTVRGVIVTKVTVETKPWMVQALEAGLTDHYKGLKPTDTAAGAAAVKGHVGDNSAFYAEEVDKGVERALVAFRDFYK